MSWRFLVCVVCVLLWSGGALAASEGLVEVWRSPFGNPRAISVDSASGTCWAATGCSVMHLDGDGNVLSQTDGFWNPLGVGAVPGDGSCWVADTEHGRVVQLDSEGELRLEIPMLGRPEHLAANETNGSAWVGGREHPLVHLYADGTVIWGSWDFGSIRALAVNQYDGSCWVAHIIRRHVTDYWYVTHVAADGSQLWQGDMFDHVTSLSVDPRDGSCWVGRDYEIVHIAPDGTVLWQQDLVDATELSVSVNPSDGSSWVGTETRASSLLHFACDGTELWSGGGLSEVQCLAASAADGSCWVGAGDPHQVVRFDAAGDELWRTGGFSLPMSISVNPTDGALWVADWGNRDVVHLAADGTEIWRGGSFERPRSVSVDPTDGSSWVADWDMSSVTDGDVVHLASDGSEVWRGSFDDPSCVAVNPDDGTCWAALYEPWVGEVVHLSQDGAELWRGQVMESSASPSCLAVDPTDGSCWVADCLVSDPGQIINDVVRLAEDGTELWRGEYFAIPYSVAVDPTDGSCWVGDMDVIQLGADGAELSRTPVPSIEGSEARAIGVCVDVRDGSCFAVIVWTRWYPGGGVDQFGTTVHYAADGEELGRGGHFGGALAWGYTSLGVLDDIVWVPDLSNSQVVRLEVRRSPFPDLPWDSWAYGEIIACIEAGIIAGYDDGLYRPTRAVTRDQMAVYVSRALAGGDENVPAFTDAPTFPDVPAESWAVDYVEYAVEQAVVAGYDDGRYHPEYEVTRDQMAVYVARALVAPSGEAGLAGYVPGDPRNFPDVPDTSWAYTHIEYCVENGVVKGYGDGRYHPEYVVTRDQMAVYIARAFELTP